MNSSTSSFRRELKVVAIVIATLAIAEVVLRLAAVSVSADLKSIANFYQVGQELAVARQRGKRTVLFIGNSMVREDIDLETLRKHVENEETYHFAKCTADATAVSDWYFAFKRYFVHPQLEPDVLAICYSGYRVIGDEFPIDLRRLAQYFCDDADLLELLVKDAKTFDDQAVVMLSKISWAFANRERVQRRLMYWVISDYAVSSQRMNAAAGLQPLREVPSVRPLTRLTRFVQAAQDQGIRVVLVALQRVRPYEIDPSLRSLITAKDLHLMDLRDVDGIQDEMIPDGLHMTEEAARLLSEELAHRLDEPGILRDPLDRARAAP